MDYYYARIKFACKKTVFSFLKIVIAEKRLKRRMMHVMWIKFILVWHLNRFNPSVGAHSNIILYVLINGSTSMSINIS